MHLLGYPPVYLLFAHSCKCEALGHSIDGEQENVDAIAAQQNRTCKETTHRNSRAHVQEAHMHVWLGSVLGKSKTWVMRRGDAIGGQTAGSQVHVTNCLEGFPVFQDTG